MNLEDLRPRVFLLGPHGSGKGRLGRALGAHGYFHISVGALGRLARRRQFVSDVPMRLQLLMSRHEPGTPLAGQAVDHLVDHVRSRQRVVVDGFPGSTDHLAVLGDLELWSFVYVYTPKVIREARLMHRAEKTVRKWTPGGLSARDLALPHLCREIRERTTLHVFNNAAHQIEHESILTTLRA